MRSVKATPIIKELVICNIENTSEPICEKAKTKEQRTTIRISEDMNFLAI